MLSLPHCLEALVIALTTAVVNGFPSGAPLSACGHLMPIHEDAVAQGTASPYLLLLSHTNYTSRQPISLRVSSGEPFLAFMLQGRTRNGKPVGSFSMAPPVSKFLNCYAPNDTFSHAAAFGRTAMEVVWQPPTEDVGDVFITGSVAKTKYIFWAVETESIKGPGGNRPPPVAGARAGAGNRLSHEAGIWMTWLLATWFLTLREHPICQNAQ